MYNKGIFFLYILLLPFILNMLFSLFKVLYSLINVGMIDTLIKAVSELVPLSRTAKEQIELLKEWASTGRARPAS